MYRDISARYSRETSLGNAALRLWDWRLIAARVAGAGVACERGIIVDDNAHGGDEFLKALGESGQKFPFREKPTNHWYLGVGIGASFRESA